MNNNAALRDIFARLRKQHVRYSLRKFSLDCGINIASLSRALSDREELSFFHFKKLLKSPKISPRIKEKLKSTLIGEITGAAQTNPQVAKKDEFKEVDLSFNFKWTDIALMDYLQLAEIDCSVDKLAQALSVNEDEILESIDRLERCGFIEEIGDHYVKRHKKLIIGADDKSKKALREFHRNFALRGLQELNKPNESDVDQRLINSYVIATRPEKIEAAKKAQLRFQKQLIKFMTSEEPTCLYGLSNLFFPLTSVTKR